MNLLLAQVKPYLYGALVIGIVLGALYVCGLVKSKEAWQSRAITAESDLEAKTKVLDAERIANKLVEQNRDEYLKDREQMRNEITTLKSNVSNGSTILRIAAKCPSVPATTAYTGGTPTASPELTEDARSAYYTHIEDEDRLNGLLDMCVRQLKIDRGLVKPLINP